MTKRHPRPARSAAIVFGVLVVGLASVLVADDVRSRARLAGDSARIEMLQGSARADAAASGLLAAEQAAITSRRLARKARTRSVGLALLFAACGFVASMKWRQALGPRRPVPPPPDRVPGNRPVVPAWPAAGPRAERAGEPEAEIVRRIVAEEGRESEAAIRILQAIQARFRYLPDSALALVCQLTAITPAQLAGTSTFYARFRRSPVGDRVIRVCHGTACHVSGARHITDELRRCLQMADGEDTDPQRRFTIDEVACVGCCSLAPVVMVDEHTAGRLTPDAVRTLVGAAGER
jgi:NADH:ubiquinone oxidoreductase subunit E